MTISQPHQETIEDALSSNFHDYFPATSGNNSPNSLDDFTKYLLATLVFSPLHDNLYMEVMPAYDAIDNKLPISNYYCSTNCFASIFSITNVGFLIFLSSRGDFTETSESPTSSKFGKRHYLYHTSSGCILDSSLEAQAANMENTDNTIGPRETPITRKCTYKEFMSCQHFYFNGTEGAVGLIHWFERTESVFSRSNYTEDCKVKFTT
nr:reverse transcriptase domain-containing protein [Tanacetum cinerariifolium]